MNSTQFSMVEELTSIVKDNLTSKHLILSVEELLVDFLADDTCFNGVLELEPMNPYNRLLVHRLADIFGFSHQSVGEGEARHLVLERCPETSVPPILVSDLVLQYNEMQPSMINIEEPRWNEVTAGQRKMGVSKKPSLEEREACYVGARERIFFSGEAKVVKEERRKHDPVVARRMIAHALGHQSTKLSQSQPKASSSDAAKSLKFDHEMQRDICCADKNSMLQKKDCSHGAAKRLFANALRMHPRDGSQSPNVPHQLGD